MRPQGLRGSGWLAWRAAALAGAALTLVACGSEPSDIDASRAANPDTVSPEASPETTNPPADAVGVEVELGFHPRTASVQRHGVVVVEPDLLGPGGVKAVLLIDADGRTVPLDMPEAPDGQVWTGIAAVSVRSGFAVGGSLCTPYENLPSRCQRTTPLVAFYDAAGRFVGEQRAELTDTLVLSMLPGGEGVVAASQGSALITVDGVTELPGGTDLPCGGADGLVGVTINDRDPERIEEATSYQPQVLRDASWRPEGEPLEQWTPLISPICVPGGVLIEDHFFDGRLSPLTEQTRASLEEHAYSLNVDDVVGTAPNGDLLLRAHTTTSGDSPGVSTGWIGLSADRSTGLRLVADGVVRVVDLG